MIRIKNQKEGIEDEKIDDIGTRGKFIVPCYIYRVSHKKCPTLNTQVSKSGAFFMGHCVDWESIRSSPRDGLSTSYRLTEGILLQP